MSATDLAKIQPKLDALDREDVREPLIPMSVFQQEANDTLTWLDDEAKAKRLLDVGLDPRVLADAREALPGMRYAQSLWYATWSGRKPSEQKQLEDEASETRDEAFAACRWNLRGDRQAMQTLDRIADGDGVADLVADLDDLATLIETNVAAFGKDKSFPAADKAQAARALAVEVRAGLSEFRTSDTQKKSVDLRNRAFTYFSQLFGQIRAAGSHAYRKADERRRFQSNYERQKRGRAKPKEGGGTPA